MKTYNNEQKPDLKQTIDSIGMMYRSLHSIYEDQYHQSPFSFAAMAQGPIDEIRGLLDDVEGLMQSMIPSELREQARQLEEQQEQADTIAA